ncbi:MAG: TIGR00266 family protein [Ruminococcaceae bacterium]|nr:TIGR00266 family protein [Oscillospiraceae bacterium]
MKYSIEGGSLPVVICYPEANQTICTESGSMSWMSPNMKMETNSGGGFKKMMGRLFSGDSIFMNEYTPQGASGMIAFASSFPGSIIPYEVTPGNGIIVQKSGFLAMEKGLELSIYFQKKLGKGFFGGEGFIMQKITGNGLVFLEIDGYCKEYELGVGESIVLDTGYLAAMSESCTMDIQSVKGVKNMLFGGEGLFNTVVTGPGKVYVQSMPVINTANALSPYLQTNSSGDSGGGINIKLGGD